MAGSGALTYSLTYHRILVNGRQWGINLYI